MANESHNDHGGGHGHNGPPSGEVFVTPEPWSPSITGWPGPNGYTGPVRNKGERLPVDDAVVATAAALASRRRNEYGSFVERAAAAPTRRARR